jgi:hypothetical protein
MNNEYELVLGIAKLYRTKNKGQLISALYKQLTDGLVFRYTGRPHELAQAKLGANERATALANGYYPSLPEEFRSLEIALEETKNWSSRQASDSFLSELANSYSHVSHSLRFGISKGIIHKEMQELMLRVAFGLREVTTVDPSQYKFIFDLLGIPNRGILELISFVKYFTGHLYWLAMEEVNKRNPNYEMFKSMSKELLGKVKEGKVKHDACGVIHRKVYFSEGYAIKIETSWPGGQHYNEASLWVNDPDLKLCPIEYVDNMNRLIIMRKGDVADDIQDVEKFYGIKSLEKGIKVGRNSCVYEIGDNGNWAWFNGVPLIIDYGANNQNLGG